MKKLTIQFKAKFSPIYYLGLFFVKLGLFLIRNYSFRVKEVK